MKLRNALAVLPLLFALTAFADELPDLGDASQATLSPRQEKELGLQIMSLRFAPIQVTWTTPKSPVISRLWAAS